MLCLPLSFSKKENSSIFIDQFLKEALQILKQVDTLLLDQDEQFNMESELDNQETMDTVTWHLDLTPDSMTLNTNINTISGLEKVLELIRTNVKPQPPKFKNNSRKNKTYADQFNISLFRQIIEPVLRLSIMTPPINTETIPYNPTPLMRHYIQTFIDCGYAFFLDVPTLIANTEMILSHPNASKDHKVESLLITSICSLMARHTTIHHRGDMNMANTFVHNFYAQARQLLQDLFDVHHIAVVQSLFILSLFSQGHTHLFSPARTKNTLLTMAIRMALAMDLHRLDTDHHNDSDQKEKLRRLAWLICCADYHADFNATGKTGLIDISDWHVDFPQPLPNESSLNRIEFFSHYCRIILIRKLDLFKSAYMVSLQSKRALESGLDHELFQTYFNTPDMFKLDLDRANPTWGQNDTESLLLYELYSHTQLFAQLPFLPKRYIECFVAEEAFQRSDLNDVYQHLVGTLSLCKTERSPHTQTELDERLELHCVVSFLTTLNTYTLVLEALTTIGCSHSPVYGAILTLYLYLMIDTSCTHADVRSVCQINLLRTQRLLHQAKYIDPLHKSQHNPPPKDDSISLITKTRNIIKSLQIQTTYMK